jgi:hypothetical protein
VGQKKNAALCITQESYKKVSNLVDDGNAKNDSSSFFPMMIPATGQCVRAEQVV